LKHWPIVAISLFTFSTSPIRATADSAPTEAPGLTGTAPDFQYLSNDGRWKSLHDLRSEGHVLLVFEPADAQLVGLERESDSLRHAGVIPIAVFHRRESANWSAIERLGLTFSLLSDPRGDLASEFQGVAASDLPRPGWYLVDRDGRICALERGAIPESGFTGTIDAALQPRERASAVKP
jgi:peroxiredoxin